MKIAIKVKVKKMNYFCYRLNFFLDFIVNKHCDSVYNFLFNELIQFSTETKRQYY